MYICIYMHDEELTILSNVRARRRRARGSASIYICLCLGVCVQVNVLGLRVFMSRCMCLRVLV